MIEVQMQRTREDLRDEIKHIKNNADSVVESERKQVQQQERLLKIMYEQMTSLEMSIKKD